MYVFQQVVIRPNKLGHTAFPILKSGEKAPGKGWYDFLGGEVMGSCSIYIVVKEEGKERVSER